MNTARSARDSRFWTALVAGLLFTVTSADAQDARVAIKPGVIAQAQFVAPDFGPAQHADFQVDSADGHRLRGYLIGSEGLCHGRFQVEGRWISDELVIKSPSKFGMINAQLRSIGARTLKGPFTVAGKRGEMTLNIAD